jgi:hypothetical protein
MSHLSSSHGHGLYVGTDGPRLRWHVAVLSRDALVSTATLVLPGSGPQRDDRVDVVALHWIVGDPVGTDETADDASDLTSRS